MLKDNLKLLWTLGMIIMSVSLSAQEICDNGIDDDGDSLIDINDDECICTNLMPLTDISGNPCTRIDLTLDVPDGTSYQWYKNGIALAGQNNAEIEIDRFDPLGNGTYQVYVVTPSGCVASEPYVVERDEFFNDLGDIFICEGDSVSIGGKIFDSEGFQRFKTSTPEGCDSTIMFEIILYPETEDITIDESMCIGGTYVSESGNIVTTEPGIYMDTLKNAAECDSMILTINLTFEDQDPIILSPSICSGDTYVFHDIIATESGPYETRVPDGNNCDSVFIINLTVLPPLEESRTETICTGGVFELGNISTSDAGNYQADFITADGCDSIVYVELLVDPVEEYTVTLSACEGKTVIYGGTEYDESGIYDYYSTEGPCDSLIHVDVTITTEGEVISDEVVCQGKTFEWRGTTYDTEGRYEDLESNQGECEILHVLNLTFSEPEVIALNEVICNGNTYEDFGFKADTTGIYTNLFSEPGECDVMYELDLTILSHPATLGKMIS